MGLFNRTKPQHTEPEAKEVERMDDATGASDVSVRIEAAMKKSLTYANYEAWDVGNENGGMFGQEFDIKTTAGRIKALYTREPWIYTTASLIARTLAGVPMKVYRTGTEDWVKDHPLQKLIVSGNRMQDGMSRVWAGNLDLVLGGNCFLVLDAGFREVVHTPVEYCSLNMPETPNTAPSLTVWNPQQGKAKATVDVQHYIHLKLPNPFNPYWGLSPFAAAARPILLDRYKNEFEMAFYLRGCTNSGVIETTEDLSRTRMERLMRTFENAFTGKANWWRTLFLPKGAKWVNSSLSMSDMEHLEGLKENRRTILAVLGIPPAMVGFVEDVNRSNSEEQTKTFWENTIKPTAWFWCAGWNNSYLFKNVYGGQYEVRPDFSDVEALQGSVITKGEQSKAMAPYFFIDEIRSKVWKEAPLPNGAGQKIASTSPAASGSGNLSLAAPQDAPPGEAPPTSEMQTVSDEVQAEAVRVQEVATTKATAINSQNRLEDKLGNDFEKGFNAYLDKLLSQAEKALKEHRDVTKYLKAFVSERKVFYWDQVKSTLERAMDRGFSMSNGQTKRMQSGVRIKASVSTAFTEADRQAIDVLREKTRDEQRKVLAKRGLSVFEGFDEKHTEQIMQVIENGLASGLAQSEIASRLKSDFGEAYPNQSRTIVRTETLSAVSVGMKWHQDVLGEVFTKVQKQWLSQDDEHVRPDHKEFDSLGVVADDYQYAEGLPYPRAYGAAPEQAINCRCTLINVIPDDSASRADVILDTEI
jgi:HK97 family phage portal protein